MWLVAAEIKKADQYEDLISGKFWFVSVVVRP
jgi:hypothetical protein